MHTLWMMVVGAVLLSILFTVCWVSAAYGDHSRRIVQWVAARPFIATGGFYGGFLWSVGIGAAGGATAAMAQGLIHFAGRRRDGEPR